ncbi:MAG: FIST N-terminal domain-containing protein, partial [Pirellulaceae bacterium]
CSKPKFAASLSLATATEEAGAEVLREALEGLAAPVDLAMVFVSPHHKAHLETIARQLCEKLGTRNLFGCTGEAIVGNGREAEDTPAISLWVAHLPETTILPMHLEFQRTPDGGTIVGWSEQLPPAWEADSAALVLGEPFSFPADLLLERINEDHPGVPVIGGMASGGYQPGENLLIFGDQVLESGGILIYLQGAVQVRWLVSQGCRPIGEPMVITKAERNIIYELGGMPALVRLEKLFRELPVADQQLVNNGLHVGRVVDEYQESRAQGDFLVRNVVGIEKDAGALMIGDYVRTGQTVQFHIRDEVSADAELRQLSAAAGRQAGKADTALLFTCNGRGTRLFSGPHHDAACLSSALGDLPMAGFFAMGEMGPIGTKNFLHGFTASVALLGPKPDSAEA